jgi:hypothetical protein
MMGKICLAIHMNEQRFMRNYHAMDATRCFQACLQYGLGLKAFTYTALVHDWNMKKQAKKFRDNLVKDMFYFGLKTHEDLARLIDILEKRVEGTIIFSTIFAHLCEVRQCINRFGLTGTASLVRLYHTVKACKKAADDAMCAMADGTWRKTGCFAVMVLEEIRLAKNMTWQSLNPPEGSQPTCTDVVIEMSALSPKLCLEGIPEWLALRVNLDLLSSKCLASYGGLVKAAKRLDVKVKTSAGRRLSKKGLQKSIDARLQACAKMPTLPKKRKFLELEAAVLAAGGNTRPSIAGKRHRMHIDEMLDWLKE